LPNVFPCAQAPIAWTRHFVMRGLGVWSEDMTALLLVPVIAQMLGFTL
jgi:hypothetical protein